jgi:enediyne biosynthesis protein E4
MKREIRKRELGRGKKTAKSPKSAKSEEHAEHAGQSSGGARAGKRSGAGRGNPPGAKSGKSAGGDELPETEVYGDEVLGKALKWSLGILVLLGAVGGGAIYLATRPEPVAETRTSALTLPERRQAAQRKVPSMPFTDVTTEAGIDFVHESGAYGAKLLPETMGSGCAFFDFNQNGHPDLLLVNSSRWPFDRRPDTEPATMAFYENDGHGNFRDRTAEVGLDISLYGMGVGVGDFDNDGYPDLYITAVGENRLFRNVDGQRFEDVTEAAGVAGGPGDWSTSCGWFDYNNDGLLDLFVCNYVRWSKEIDESQDFRLTGVGRAYGPPDFFEGAFCSLFRNEGGGKFTDVSEEAGIQVVNPLLGVAAGKSLGVTFIDYDGDGWMDILVANDTVQNFLLRNLGEEGRFEEVARQVGVAFDKDGRARGAMGIDAGYFRNDGLLGIVIGNFANEMSALYVKQDKSRMFFDAAVSTGFGPPTRLDLTFGVFLFDCDLDGRLDILGANGHLEAEIGKVMASQTYEQSPHLFWNAGLGGGSEFVRVPPDNVGADFSAPLVGRGATFADIDGDGDLDVLITSCGGQPRLLRNDQTSGHHWLRVDLVGNGTTSNRDAIGAWVELHQGDEVQRRQVMPTRSYLSQVEKVVTFGLGTNDRVDRLVIRWPDGTRQELTEISVDQQMVVRQ